MPALLCQKCMRAVADTQTGVRCHAKLELALVPVPVDSLCRKELSLGPFLPSSFRRGKRGCLLGQEQGRA